MRLKLHGIFARDFGPEYDIEADTIAEAVEGLTRQIGFYDYLPIEFRPVARIAGVDDPLALFDKTEQKEIHIVPAMIGGGGVGKILIGAALIGFALTNPLGWALTAGSLAAGVMSAGIAIGATLILSGAMQLFMKAPSVSKANDPEASKYMGIGDNTISIGTPIPIQYGRGPATGHLLAINVDSSDMVVGNFPATTT